MLKNTIILLAFFPLIGFSQQARFSNLIDHSGISYSFTFHSQFLSPKYDPILFDNKTEFYRSKRIRQIDIKNQYGNLVWRMRLDSAGHILSIRKPNNGYYLEYEEHQISEKESIQISRFYNESQTQLIRIDTVKYITFEFSSGDSIFGYTIIENRKYKSGSLINTQNLYYNTNYLNKKIDPNSYTLNITIDIGSNEKFNQSNVYFNQPFKTDYDSLTMYCCFSERQIENQFGYLKSNGNSFDIENSTNRFIKNPTDEIYFQFITDGEWFNEPIQTIYQTVHIDDTDYETNNGYEKGYNYDENGLITEYFTNYYPEDTMATNQLKRKIESEQSSQNNYQIGGRAYYQNIIRNKEAIRIETYYYLYEFYP